MSGKRLALKVAVGLGCVKTFAYGTEPLPEVSYGLGASTLLPISDTSGRSRNQQPAAHERSELTPHTLDILLAHEYRYPRMTVGPMGFSLAVTEFPRMKRKALSILASVAILGAQASASPASAQQSQVACDAYARNYARDASRQGKVLGGGVVGSLIGLGIGAATGGAAVGAAIGGGVGIIGGGARRQKDAERIYRAAFNDCMAGRIK